jgi:hydrogenase nickel incorporation protein HypB
MCKDCGCGPTSTTRIDGAEQPALKRHLLEVNLAAQLHAANEHEAAHNREHFDAHGVLAVNLMSAPGSGKTALLEATIQRFGALRRMAVIEGDLETENDAARIRRHGVPAIQITTGTACHLDAPMVHSAAHRLDLASIELLFIENVGNLVCPAGFDVGAHANVALLSMAEGDDKPAKYPVMFRAADLVLITKSDLAAVFDDFDLARATRHVREVGCAAPVLPVSSKSGAGLDAWWSWLEQARESATARGAVHSHVAHASHSHHYAHGHSHDRGSAHAHTHARGTQPAKVLQRMWERFSWR